MSYVFVYYFRFFQLSATRHLNTDSDTELLTELFSMELASRRPAIGPPVTRELLFEVVQVHHHIVLCFPTLGSRCTVVLGGFGMVFA